MGGGGERERRRNEAKRGEELSKGGRCFVERFHFKFPSVEAWARRLASSSARPPRLQGRGAKGRKEGTAISQNEGEKGMERRREWRGEGNEGTRAEEEGEELSRGEAHPGGRGEAESRAR